VQKILQQQKIPLQMADYLMLSPDQHQTDGFFAAVCERVVS
jgi:16S rRNA (cytosine967-C5)-methyltransferase